MSLRMRRGGADPGSPPTPSGYGPTAGAQPVRDGTIPHAVTIPSGTFTTVNPGDNIAGKITTAGTNGKLWFTKGPHPAGATLAPLAGQQWYLESPAGYTRDATDSAVLTGNDAIQTALVQTAVAGVQIRGGVFEHQGTALSEDFRAAIQHTNGAAAGGGSWLVEDAIIRNNRVKGLILNGPNSIARRCYIHSNGMYGISGGTTAVVSGTTYEYCRVSNNNTLHFNPVFDAGGTKWSNCPSTTVQYSWFHDNYGSGVWFDGTNYNILIQENVIENNRNWGVFYEISYGGTMIKRNLLSHNGEGDPSDDIFNNPQLLVSTCDGQGTGSATFQSIDITKNQIIGFKRAVYLIDTAGHISGFPGTRSVHVYDNDITFTTSATDRVGAGGNTTSDQIYTRDNTFEDNHYHTPNTALAYFHWSGGSPGVGVDKTWAQWNAFGHDTPGGSIV